MRKKVQPITVWQALNEPVVEVTERAAKAIFAVAAFVLMLAWLAPYLGPYGSARSHPLYLSRVDNGYYQQVAGAQTTLLDADLTLTSAESIELTPQWYFTASALPNALAENVTAAAYELLDISDPVIQISEFYEPGFQAVSDAWLELMADPYY